MNVDQWITLATAYFNSEMSAEEARLFENETAASEELSQLMQLWKNTDLEAELYEQQAPQADAFITTHRKMKQYFLNMHAAKHTFGAWRWVAAAAVIAGIAFLVKMILPSPQSNTSLAEHTNNSDTSKKTSLANSGNNAINKIKKKETDSALQADTIHTAILFAQTFEPDEVPEDPNGPLDDAFFYYSSGQYKKAIKAIDSIGNRRLTRGNDGFAPLMNFYALYYKALSMMSLGNEGGALPLLKKSVTMNVPAKLKVKAEWYLALGYLRQGNVSLTDNTLKLLTDNPSAGPYKRRAEQLLQRLNK